MSDNYARNYKTNNNITYYTIIVVIGNIIYLLVFFLNFFFLRLPIVNELHPSANTISKYFRELFDLIRSQYTRMIFTAARIQHRYVCTGWFFNTFEYMSGKNIVLCSTRYFIVTKLFNSK